ncbi:MAG TPA: CBS domain-containing protein [Candidatus Aenigmarchaeota archaeon]|nr:CBS domain-containing protein [Candidatus Aenigmarchaeota archaeon]
MLPRIDEIRKRREALGVSVSELASESGFPESFIEKIESGEIKPPYPEVRKIFDTLEAIKERKSKTTKPVKVKDIMNKNLIYVQATDTVARAISLMRKHNITHLPVFRNNHDVGCLSEKIVYDYMFKGYEDISDFMEEIVGDVMDRPLPKVDENEPVESIMDVLERAGAVLVRSGSEIVGIVTITDTTKVMKKP